MTAAIRVDGVRVRGVASDRGVVLVEPDLAPLAGLTEAELAAVIDRHTKRSPRFADVDGQRVRVLGLTWIFGMADRSPAELPTELHKLRDAAVRTRRHAADCGVRTWLTER